MALKRLATTGVLWALLLDSSPVKAAGSVIRIDLEKHYMPHQEIEDLEESEENDQIQIVIEDTSYAQLRDMQKSHISKSFSKLSQKSSSSLVQESASVNNNEVQTLTIDTQSDLDVDASIAADQ